MEYILLVLAKSRPVLEAPTDIETGKGADQWKKVQFAYAV